MRLFAQWVGLDYAVNRDDVVANSPIGGTQAEVETQSGARGEREVGHASLGLFCSATVLERNQCHACHFSAR